MDTNTAVGGPSTVTTPSLRQLFAHLEQQAALLPVVQVSTFSCGSDSIIQPLFSADGGVDSELLTLALLKVMGPEGYYCTHTPPATTQSTPERQAQ